MQASEVRRRALRAAQLVTLSASVLGTGCPTTTAEVDARAIDTNTTMAEVDAGACVLAAPDGGAPEAGSGIVLTTEGCCTEIGGFWTGTVCQVEVFGPFVPPSILG